MLRKSYAVVALATINALLVGCSQGAPDDSDVPLIAEDTVEENQLVTVNGWTLDALSPQLSPNQASVKGVASFTGSGVAPAGACLLKEYLNKTTWLPVACNTVDDCNSAPTTLPSGGYRYCTWDNGAGSGQKYCFFRPGPASSFCTGTPVTGAPIAAGTYSTPWFTPGGAGGWDRNFISYACYAGCSFSDPSSSSTTIYVPPGGP